MLIINVLKNPFSVLVVDVVTKQNYHINKSLIMLENVIYHSVDDIQAFLKQQELKHPNVKKLFELYCSKYQYKTNNTDDLSLVPDNSFKRKYPLIVFEGLDGSGKTTITRKLAEKLNATLYCTPPPCLHEIRFIYDDDKLLRTAYYSLGNYIAAEEMKLLLNQTPVVLDRFWHSTVAYSLAQAVHDNPKDIKLPEQNDQIYCWPNDLLKPDIVFFLKVSEDVRQKRMFRRNISHTTQEKLLKTNTEFRNNVIKVYENYYNPTVKFINGDPPVEEVLEDILV